MSKQILISLITSDLTKSTAFYAAVGFTNKSDFPHGSASQMMWSEEIVFMLLSPELARTLNHRNKQFVDQKNNVSVVFTLMCDSKEAVDEFCKLAKEAGGTIFTNTDNGSDSSDEFMYSFEVEDPDGYILQPTFMDMSKFPQK
jgi:uncharacterized protein